MKKIGDKYWILSPITGFQLQNRFEIHRTQALKTVTTSNNSWKMASLRWRGDMKVGSMLFKQKDGLLSVVLLS